MVSLDSVEKNRSFAESLEAELVLLSDPDRLNARAFGVVGRVWPFPKRWTFYIDEDGIIVYIDKDVDPAAAGTQIVTNLERLGFAHRSEGRDASP